MTTGEEMDKKFQRLEELLMPSGVLADNWMHRSKGMRCESCMWFVGKSTDQPTTSMRGYVGRCRRHAPTMNGWPVMFSSDWCGDHKIDENKV